MNLKLWKCDDGTYDVLDLDTSDDCEWGSPAIVAFNVTAEYILAGCRFKQVEKENLE